MVKPATKARRNSNNVSVAPVTPASSEPTHDDLPSHALGATITGAALAAAIQNGNGMLYGDAAPWLLLAIATSLLGILSPPASRLQRLMAAAVPWAVLGGIFYAFYMWPFARPALYMKQPTSTTQTVFMVGVGAAAVLSGLSLSTPPWLKRFHLPLLVGTYFVLGCWVLQVSPTPIMDVVTLHNESIKALLHGENPFAITWPNIYPDGSHYPPGLVKDGRVLFGYDYPPVNLLAAIPGYILGDYRYALLIANCVSAVLLSQLAGGGIDSARRSPHSLAFVALFLFTPRAMLMLEQGWTEPFSVLFLMATLWFSMNRPQWVPYALGLLLASKQYVVLLMASAIHLPTLRQVYDDRQALTRFALQTLGSAAAVTLPFFLWSPTAFLYSVVQVPIMHPFREDALSFLAWYRKVEGTLLPTYFGFLAAAVASVVAWRRLPSTLAGFAYSFGFIFLFFIAFNRQAFCNYYFLVIAAFYAAAALGQNDGAHLRLSK